MGETDTPNLPVPSLLAQRGRFTLATQVVTDIPETAVKVLAGMLVTRCEHSFAEQLFRYEAISEHFEPLEDGEALPSYDVSYDEESETTSWVRSAGTGAP